MYKAVRAIIKAWILSISGLLLIVHGMAMAQSEIRLNKNEQEGKLTSIGLWISAHVEEINVWTGWDPLFD